MTCRYFLLALAVIIARNGVAAGTLPFSAREPILPSYRVSISNEGSIGYALDRTRTAIWPRTGSTGCFDIGGLWIVCKKRVGGTVQQVVMRGFDPVSRRRAWTQGQRDDRFITDTVVKENAQVFSSAFVASEDADPYHTYVWPMRTGVEPAFVRDPRARALHPPLETGDEDVVARFTDTDPAAILTPSFGLPLGVDAQLVTSSWRTGPLADALVCAWTITNRSTDTLLDVNPVAVFASAIGDTSEAAPAENDRAARGTTPTSYVVAVDSGANGHRMALVGLGQPTVYGAFGADRIADSIAAYTSVMTGGGMIDTTAPFPVITASQRTNNLLPGASVTLRCAVVFAASDSALHSSIDSLLAADARAFAGTRNVESILDVLVSDSATAVALMADVRANNGSFDADIMTGSDGSARFKAIPRGRYSVVASADGYETMGGSLRLEDSVNLFAIILPRFRSPLLPGASPNPFQLGTLTATLRVISALHARPHQGHKLAVVSDGAISNANLRDPAIRLPWHLEDLDNHEVLYSDTLATTFHPCGGDLDSVHAARIVTVDSAFVVSVAIAGMQLAGESTLAAHRTRGISDIVPIPLGTEQSPGGFDCTNAASGTMDYHVRFVPAGETLIHVGPYLVTQPLLAPEITAGIARLPHGAVEDSLNAGAWTLRVGAWKKRAGTFLGYPCLDGDSALCGVTRFYLPSVSLEPLDNDSIVYAHCLTIGGNRYGIDFSGRGLPDIASWPSIPIKPTRDISSQDTVDIVITGGFTAPLPVDSSLISFPIPFFSAVTESPVAPTIDVWPVPARDELHVAGGRQWELRDLFGRVALRTEGTVLSTARLSPGMYMLRGPDGETRLIPVLR